jgi:hypothetical protein
LLFSNSFDQHEIETGGRGEHQKHAGERVARRQAEGQGSPEVAKRARHYWFSFQDIAGAPHSMDELVREKDRLPCCAAFAH